MAKGATPGREQIIRRMWKLANAGVEDAVKLACFPTEEWGGLEGMNLDALTEFKRGSNGVVELKFTDRARLLERLLDAADHSAGFAESEDAVIVFAALAILAASDAPRISRDIFFMC